MLKFASSSFQTSSRSTGSLPVGLILRKYWSVINNARKFALDVEVKLSITNLDDWYRFTYDQVASLGIKAPLLHYKGLVPLLRVIYPDHCWSIWQFAYVPHGYWKDELSLKAFVRFMELQLSLSSLENWMEVTPEIVKSLGGQTILLYHNWTLIPLFQSIYDGHEWDGWQYPHMPPNFWRDAYNAKRFVKHVERTLDFISVKDWCNATVEKVLALGGKAALDLYNGLEAFLCLIYPDHDWHVLGSTQLNVEHGSGVLEEQYTITYVKYVELMLNFTCAYDWHQATQEEIDHYSELAMLVFTKPLLQLLQDAYPAHVWQISWLLSEVNCRALHSARKLHEYARFLEFLLSVVKLENWHAVGQGALETSCGKAFVEVNGGLVSLLRSVYPEHHWNEWEFPEVLRNFWLEFMNVIHFVKYMEHELNISTVEDWSCITQFQVSQLGGEMVLKHYRTIPRILQTVYPGCCNHYPANAKSQQLLFNIVSQLFSASEVISDHQLPVKYSSGGPVELDLYIPSAGLALEYQGKQHYEDHHTHPGYNTRGTLLRDQFKRQLCHRLGITLVAVPYWWELNLQSLTSTVHKYRPDLLRAERTPIGTM